MADDSNGRFRVLLEENLPIRNVRFDAGNNHFVATFAARGDLSFLLSRAVVLTILILIPLLTLLAPTSDGVRAVAFSHGGLKSAAAISNALLAGDAVHYRDIAQHGYLKPMSRGWFRFSPLVWRFFAAITGETRLPGVCCRTPSF